MNPKNEVRWKDDGVLWDEIVGINAYGEEITHILPQERGHSLNHLCPCGPVFNQESSTYVHSRAH